MKRLLSVFLAILLLGYGALSASAASVELSADGKTVVDYGDWILEKINHDTEWELDEYKGTEVNVITPRIIDDMIVVSFGDHCFANNSNIVSVVTSSPLWTVGEYAFIDCKALVSFECNYALNTIETGAFSGTSSLKNINLETSVITQIMPYTFLNSGIEEITLPSSCTTLGSYSFGQCTQLKKITIPASVNTIHDDAFAGCDDLVIHCTPDSYAHQYAVEKNIPCVLFSDVTYVLGDADGDGKVNVIDVTTMQRVIVRLIEDADGMISLRSVMDGSKLNGTHVTRVQRYLVNIPVDVPIGTEMTRRITL